MDGACHDTILPFDKQEVIVSNRLHLGVWYMSSLVEFLGAFATSRNGSEWTSPYMAVGLAAMVWSRISVLNTPIRQNELDFQTPEPLASLTPEDAGASHPIEDTAKYIWPTLRKARLLYCLLGIQPLLTTLNITSTSCIITSNNM